METPPQIPEEKNNPIEKTFEFLNKHGVLLGMAVAIGIPLLGFLVFFALSGLGIIFGAAFAGFKGASESVLAPPFAYQFHEQGKLDFRPFGGDIETHSAVQLINQTQAQTSVYCSIIRNDKLVYRELITVPGNGQAWFHGNSKGLYSKNPDDWEELIFPNDIILIERNNYSKTRLKVP